MQQVKKLDDRYNPKDFEDRLYQWWVDEGFFTPEVDESKKPFTIVIPPPNITGQLHMGHALDNTIQDILIRWNRMKGVPTLWLPGTDHASIATEVKIVEKMAEEGLTKQDLGRERFLERAWEWKEEFGGRIIEQLKKLGSSCDWTRERFTMDEGCSEAVKEFFVSLYERGLIYRGDRIINWCPTCKTSLSDAEVEHQEKEGNFWYIKYPLKESQDFVVVATTRPETMLGDTCVAVHPEDPRYSKYIGKTIILPLMGREIPIVADAHVDVEKGTGAVKVTPGHDPNDFEIGERHGVEKIRIMNDDGTLNARAGKYQGMDRYEARKAVIRDLESQGLLLKTEEIKHSVGHCYRCDTVVEPLISMQWFVRMRPLAEPAIEAVKSGRIRFVPQRFDKIYFHWMENIKDWCISRQLWWGHRIPAYYCGECGETIVSREEPKECSKCGSQRLEQDPDTLDTWFSSGLWPFSTLGWPEKTGDLEYFYPTSVLVTGYDIIFFWVARMIVSGLDQMEEIPFKDVLIHGLVRDSEGRKMSKSLGNGIDPLEIIEEYSADALRFTLATGNAPGNDMRFYMERVEASSNFANKLWNASRFVLMNLEGLDTDGSEQGIQELPLELSDRWILSRYNNLVKEVTESIEKYELGLAAQKLYDFIWSEYCDWYIELVKYRLYGDNNASREAAQKTLCYVLDRVLRLLHPFMPFVTEEIWQHVPHEGKTITLARLPEYQGSLDNPEAEKDMGLVMDAIRAVRNIRAQMDVAPSRKARIIVVAEDAETRGVFERNKPYIEKLASASGVSVMEGKEGIPGDAVAAVIEGAEVFIPLDELVDIDREIDRLEKERERLEQELQRVTGKLSNRGFLDKAPRDVIEAEQEKEKKYRDMMNKVLDRLETLKR
ncbi:MAG: Valyl-tRNA synthetase [Firmicutes bacterium]|nr:Valyl-tRNA synthetase [Bacillota bacterium]MDI6706712.1 valine--tRNA ligase [Bacillota bacterium]